MTSADEAELTELRDAHRAAELRIVELRAQISRVAALLDMQHADSLIPVGEIRKALDDDSSSR